MISPKPVIIFLISLFLAICTLGAFTSALTVNSTREMVQTAPADALIVPDNYPTIQAAVGNASAGETIFVKRGTYTVVGLEINKPLQLIGQDASTTILDGKADILSSGGGANLEAISLHSAVNVKISGFTFTNCQNAITVRYSSSGIITENNFLDNSLGIRLERETTDFTITENYLSNNGAAISLSDNVKNIEISRNILSENGGMTVYSSENVTIAYNEILNNSAGIYLSKVSNSAIYGNNITGNTQNYQIISDSWNNPHASGYGIQFRDAATNVTIYKNTFNGNIFGISIRNSVMSPLLPDLGSGNLVYRNNFLNNSQNVGVEHGLSYSSNLANGTTSISWDNGTFGNYWGDYQSKYSNTTEVDNSGIGNTPYVIDEDNVDHYPLMQQVITVEEPPIQPSAPGIPILTTATVILLVILIVVIPTVIILMRKKKSREK
jgi:parallel beta-helix repeat protein